MSFIFTKLLLCIFVVYISLYLLILNNFTIMFRKKFLWEKARLQIFQKTHPRGRSDVLSCGFSRDISRGRFSDKAPVGRRAKPRRRRVLIGRQSQSAAENLEARSWYAVGGCSWIKGFSFEFHVSQLCAWDNPGAVFAARI